MNHQVERYKFIEAMRAEGVPQDVALLVLRHANTIQRCAMLECSSEAADRDRVHCPGRIPHALLVDRERCLCRDYGSADETGKHHGMIPRIARTSDRSERRIATLLAPFNVTPIFHGDPRGACVKLQVPSGKTDDWGREGLCVPTRNY